MNINLVEYARSVISLSTEGEWERRGKQTVGVGSTTVCRTTWKNGAHNANFIVAAHKLMPEMADCIEALETQLADLRLELLSAQGEAGANLDRAVKAEAALAALRDDPSALTVAYLAGVESERDRARIERGGP